MTLVLIFIIIMYFIILSKRRQYNIVKYVRMRDE